MFKEPRSKALGCFVFCQILFVILLISQPWTSAPAETPVPPPAAVTPPANPPTTAAPPPVAVSPPPVAAEESFLALAQRSGTDKVTTHQYQHCYQRFLQPWRHKPVKMLEIGLGCNMKYGPGKSVPLWNDFFTHPDTKIYFIEYDASCMNQWKDSTIAKYPRLTLVAGDQENEAFLNSFIAENGGKESFDIIVDDGGHSMGQQWTSLRVLWDLLKPGGIYFVEDLLTSFMPGYGGDASGKKPETMVNRIKALTGTFYPNDLPSWLPENMKNKQPNVFGGNHVISSIFAVSVYHEVTMLEKYKGQKVALYAK